MVDWTRPFSVGPIAVWDGGKLPGARRPWSGGDPADTEGKHKAGIMCYDSQERIDGCLERCPLPECNPHKKGCLLQVREIPKPTKVSREIYALWNSGLGIKEIAEKTGKTQGCISGHLRRFGPVVKERAAAQRQKALAQAREMIGQGYRAEEIAAQLGLGKRVVLQCERELKNGKRGEKNETL
ncbi:hypothetical protein D1159_03720 [Pseudoflavonifractor sp. 524-17]|nr:hypothetical protein [Pseudoflavonifractor sp. 524-17]